MPSKDPEKVKESRKKCYRKHQKKRILGQRNYRLNNPEKVKESNHKCYLKHREERLQFAKEYRRNLSPEQKQKNAQRLHEWHKKNPLRSKEWHFAKKFEIISHYTNEQFTCQNCGIDGICFLTVDHIEGRKKMGHDRYTGTSELYRYILKNQFPSNFQILCFNCNMKKEIIREKELSQNLKNIKRRYLRRKLKVEVFSEICKSNPRCQCCGYDDLDGLSVDHIEGRKKMGHDRRFRAGDLYAWIKRNNYPSGFQILCINCNSVKWQLGECPHLKKT
jgi:hypothetical protein